jgi:hypothetical protein
VRSPKIRIALLVCASLVACSDTEADRDPSTSSPKAAAPESTSGSSEPDQGDPLSDGEHVVYITSIDEQGATMAVDLVEMLTGQAAVDAYFEDTGSPLDGEQFYLRNENDRLRTLPVDPSAGPFSIIDMESCCEPIEVGFAALAETQRQRGDDGEAPLPFTITVASGTITSAVQMYLP